jgi:hypothetical protein
MTEAVFDIIIMLLAMISTLALLSTLACLHQRRPADAKLNFRVAILAAAAAVFFDFLTRGRL